MSHNSSCRVNIIYEFIFLSLALEFKAVIVLPTITHNYGNYPYGNYVSNAPVGKAITLNT